MSENKVKKLRSLAVVMVMVFSSLAVINLLGVVDYVQAGESIQCDGYGVPTDFNLTGPTNDTVFKQGDTINITWMDSQNETSYNISIYRYDVLVHYEADCFNGNLSTGALGYYHWVTNYSTLIGKYNVTMCAYNNTGIGNSTWSGDTHNADGLHFNISYGTPGHTAFQGANETVASNGYNILSSANTDYRYGNTYTSILVNVSQGWEASTIYYLWKPEYNGTKTTASQYGLRWIRTTKSFTTADAAADWKFNDVTFDRAGLYLIEPDPDTNGATDADFTSWNTFNSTVAAWFWVNTSSDDYTLTISDSQFTYNSTGTTKLTVLDAADVGVDAMTDIRYVTNDSSIKGRNYQADSNGEFDYYKNRSYFWNAGNYSAQAYQDLDVFTYNAASYYTKYLENNMGGGTGHQHYNSTYGAASSLQGSDAWNTVSAYNWTLAGSWDPPEQNVTPTAMRVETGTPYTLVTNATQYYGFSGEVNISIAEISGGAKFITGGTILISVYTPDDVNVTQYFIGRPGCTGNIDKDNDTTTAQGYIKINSTAWGKDGTTHIGANGTWYAYIVVDRNSDRVADNWAEWTEEWNTTVEWTVGTAPTAQFKWIDDDGQVGGVNNWGHNSATTNENEDGVIPYVPAPGDVPLDIEFQIRDSSGGYFGDLDTALTEQSGACITVTECAENITISGNTLFTGTLDKFPGFNGGTYNAWGSADDSAECGFASDTTWHVPIIPTMSAGGSGGTITIRYTAYNTTATQTLQVGGTEYGLNGSILTVTPNNFKIEQENQTLTITCVNSETGAAFIHYDAKLYYLNDTGAVDTGNEVNTQDLSVSDTMGFNKTQQTTNQSVVDFDGDGTADAEIKAPRNLTVYLAGPGRRRSYTLIKMTPMSDFQVEIYPTTMLAGYKYSKFYVNVTLANTENETPDILAAERAKFFVKIKDSAGVDKTIECIAKITTVGKLQGSAVSAYQFEFTNTWAITPGTYTFYAYNDTHNSDGLGLNATLVVGQVDVTCDITPLVWKYDDNISATFTVTYNGEPIVGTLRIDNVSLSNDYNKTWSLTNFTGTADQSGENTSLTISPSNLPGGVVTIYDLTADHLDQGRAERNITFWFKPNSPNAGAYARCSGRVPVEVPAVSPSPQYIPLGRTSKVTLTTTGRGVALSNIFVGLNGRGISIAGTNATTGTGGKVQFSVTPSSTGEMDIHVGEDGRIVPTKVVVTSWELVIDAPVKVNEGSEFTVTLTEIGGSITADMENVDVELAGVETKKTNADGQVTFTAPAVSSDMAYTLTATKEGYVSDTASVTIINIPQLTASLKPTTAKRGAKVVVTVSKDDATPAVNALVAVEGSTTEYHTDGSGQVTITAPSKDGTYIVTASFGAFQDGTATLTVKGETPSTPGFELLTLIAALGVAFILLRRRRKK